MTQLRRLLPGEFYAHQAFDDRTVNCGALVFDCEWCGGIVESGVLLGGRFHAGEFRGGTFLGGVFMGGKWLGGHWEYGFDSTGTYRPRGDPPL